MKPAKTAGRSAKHQLTCNACQALCLPKNGDWFQAADDSGSQVFLCRPCETSRPRAVRAIPAR